MDGAEFKQGFRWEGADPEVLQAILDAAFDYRGNVTLLLVDGNELTGYVFNRRWDLPEPFVQVLLEDGSSRRRLTCQEIRGVMFTGRDTAEGRSWQTWLQKYKDKKAAEARGGATHSVDLFPESLD